MKNEDNQKNENLSSDRNNWDKAILLFGFLSEAANIGILLEMVAKWWVVLMRLGGGIFSTIAFITDPTIYFFKSLIRLTRIIGRTYFNVSFIDERNGIHPWQTAADIASLVFFALAVPMFLGLIISGPIGVTVGWVLAMCGLCISGYFDYLYQNNQAKSKFEAQYRDYIAKLENYEQASPDLKHQCYLELKESKRKKDLFFKEYLLIRNSSYLYVGLLIGLSLLLICGSAAAFAPPLVAPLLFVISKLATPYLGLIAFARFYNWRQIRKAERAEEVEIEPQQELQDDLLDDEKSKDNNQNFDPECIQRIVTRYRDYKQAAFFSPTSTESNRAIKDLANPSTTHEDRKQILRAYFFKPPNEGKSLHRIIEEELSFNKIA